MTCSGPRSRCPARRRRRGRHGSGYTGGGLDYLLTIVVVGGGLTGALAVGIWNTFELPNVPGRLGAGLLRAAAPLASVPVVWFFNLGPIPHGVVSLVLVYAWLLASCTGFAAVSAGRVNAAFAVLTVLVVSLHIPDHHLGFRLERSCFEAARDTATAAATASDNGLVPDQGGRCGPVGWEWIEVEPDGFVWFHGAEAGGSGGYVHQGDGTLPPRCVNCEELIDLGGGWWAYRPERYVN